MKSEQVVSRAITLALTVVISQVTASNRGSFSGFVGCKFDADVCQEYEFCADDCLFGSCQSPEYYDNYCHDLTSSQLMDLEAEVSALLETKHSWKDLYTQCTVGSMLISYRIGLPNDPSFCKSSPIRQEIEDQISAAEAILLEKYFSEYYNDLEPDYSRQLYPGSFSSPDSPDLNDYSYLDSYPSYNDITTRTGVANVLGNPREYFPVDKKDEYVQVHKYLKSHKRDPSFTYKPYREEYYQNKYPSQDVARMYDDSGTLSFNEDISREESEPFNEETIDYEDLVNNLSPDELALLYKYLTGEDLELEYQGGDNEDVRPGDSPMLTDSEPVSIDDDLKKPIAEDMWSSKDEEIQEAPAMSPEDAKLLGDILEGTVDINELSSSEVSRLSVYVDDMLTTLQQQASHETDMQTDNQGQERDEESPAAEFAMGLFGNGYEPEENNYKDAESKAQNIVEDENKRGAGAMDTQEADVKDYSFDDNTPKPVPTAVNKYGFLKNDKIWLKTKEKNVKLPDAEGLLGDIEGLLNATKLLTNDNNQLKVGEGNITVRLDPNNIYGYNASYIAKLAVAKKDLLYNDSEILIVDAGVGEGDDIVSVNEISHSSPKYFVLTFVLCGAVAGIVLAVIIIYIFRRHVLSKEKLQQLGSLGEVEAEASKDYQDLCRQRMQSKTSDKPEPVHVAARIGSASEVPRSTHSSRSSTSSWSEEPAVTNMDISTGHIVLSYMEDHLKNKDRLDQEWEGLVAYEAEPNSTAIASETANMRKNRYSDVLPYDHSRVVLNGATNVSGSDYINASTITDHDPRNPAYIATQGPLPHTVADFWQMVWEQGSVVIVNLTKLTEGGNAMCHRYWPEEGSDLYHIYEVHLVSEHIWCDDYLVRSFYLKNLQTNETRTVTQFHFLSWHDLDIPSSIKALLDFRRKVNKSYRGRSCPIAVHCSDGSGRSGTYCLIDMVLNRMSKGAKEIDIAATLEHIRDQRMQMVKTKEQFEFALASVAEEVTAILKALPTQ